MVFKIDKELLYNLLAEAEYMALSSTTKELI